MIEGTAILGRRGRKKKCGQISESQKVTGGNRRRSIDKLLRVRVTTWVTASKLPRRDLKTAPSCLTCSNV